MKKLSFIAGCLAVVSIPSLLVAAENARDAKTQMVQLKKPVWTFDHNPQDPSVLKVENGYRLFYSRLAGSNWGDPGSWTVSEVFTRDFDQFKNGHDISPIGHAYSGDVVWWHGRYILPYETYPAKAL